MKIQTPITVPATSAPAAGLALLRYALVALGGVLVTRGLLSEEELNELIGIVLIVAPTIWGIVRARRNVAREQVLEQHVPAEVATLKGGGSAPIVP